MRMLVLTWQATVAALTIFGFAGSFVLAYFIRETLSTHLFWDPHGKFFYAVALVVSVMIMMATVITGIPIGGMLLGFLVQAVHECLKPHYVLGIRLRY